MTCTRELPLDKRKTVWGVSGCALLDRDEDHPKFRFFPIQRGTVKGKLTVLGVSSSDRENLFLSVRCDCGRYGVINPRRLNSQYACTVCKVRAAKKVSNPDPYANYYRSIPHKLRSDDRTEFDGVVVGKSIVLGKRFGKFILKCTCGAYYTDKKLADTKCRICRDYVFGPVHIRPSWWPINKDVIQTLDAMKRMVCVEKNTRDE